MINNCKKCQKLFLSSKFVRRRGIPGELIRQAQELDLIHRMEHENVN